MQYIIKQFNPKYFNNKSKFTGSAEKDDYNKYPLINEEYSAVDSPINYQYIQPEYIDKFKQYLTAHNMDINGTYNPIVTYNEIPNDDFLSDVTYENTKKQYTKFNVSLIKDLHIGQRKLLLSEIQFFSKCVSSLDEKIIMVYAGAAPSMKAKLLMDYFPNIVFLFVDPNEFFIYNDFEKESNPHYEFINNNPDQQIYTYLSVNKSDMYYYENKNVPYYNSDTGVIETIIKPIDPARKNKNKRIKDSDVNRESITGELTQKSIDFVFESVLDKNNKRRVFMCEEFFTDSISMKIRESAEKYKFENIYFLSDIRTILEPGKENPTDTDIIVNTVWMHNWMKIMLPKKSMIKFRNPYNNPGEEVNPEICKEDYETFRNNYGFSILDDYLSTKTFKILKGDIYLQTREGGVSTETRLYIDRDSIVNNEFMELPDKEFENRMFRYNKLFRNALFRTNPNANKQIGFDCCNDCAIENLIWEEYKVLNPGFDIPNEIKYVSKLLKVGLKNKKYLFGAYGHGYLFPDIGFSEWENGLLKQKNTFVSTPQNYNR